MSDCARCTAPTADTYRLCGNCGDDIARDLQFVPALLIELETTYARRDRLTATRGRGGDDGLPWKEPAKAVAIELADVLRQWAGLVNRAGEDLTGVELGHWLWCRVDWLRARDDAEDAHRQITGVVTRALGIIDLPANRARFEVGPCPEILETGNCDGTVWAYIATRTDDMSLLRCRGCGGRWNTTQWLRIGRRILARAHQLRRRAA